MIRKSTLLGMVAALALSQSSRAEESAAPAASPSMSILTSTISCNGYSNVPMTKDQEQALPMQIIGTLECGEQVTVLSDMDAYTVNVVTQDGKNGYVARMYLTFPTRKRIESCSPARRKRRRQQRHRALAVRRQGQRAIPQRQRVGGIAHRQRRHRAGFSARHRLEDARQRRRGQLQQASHITFCRSWFRSMSSRR